VAGEFERAGLNPAGTSGYFQPVKFQSREIVEEKSSLALIQPMDQIVPVALGEDAMISMRIDPAAEIKAPVVFAGYGLTVPEMQYDDLASLDLRQNHSVCQRGSGFDSRTAEFSLPVRRRARKVFGARRGSWDDHHYESSGHGHSLGAHGAGALPAVDVA
jgi:hypothetical protein